MKKELIVKMRLFVILMTSFFVISFSVFSIVDYTEESDNSFRPNSSPKIIKSKSVSKASVGSSKSKKQGPSSIELSTGYKTLDVETPNIQGKVGVVSVSAHIETLYGIFTDINYWQASSDSKSLTESSSYQDGNSKMLVGFNWFTFGQGLTASRADIYGGFSMRATNSDFAPSRNDKMAGAQLAKRFSLVALLLGVEYRFTGNPKDEDEMKIGNIQKLWATLGFLISQDIKFSLEARTYKISERTLDDEETPRPYLDEALSYSVLIPKLILNITPNIGVNFGGYFRTKKIKAGKQDDLLKAKLYDLPGIYGNSVFAGMTISI